MENYSFLKGLLKGIKYAVIFLLTGLLVGLSPQIKAVTLGGLIVIVLNWLKIRWDIKFSELIGRAKKFVS